MILVLVLVFNCTNQLHTAEHNQIIQTHTVIVVLMLSMGEFFICIRREVVNGRLHVATTIIFSLSLAFLVLVLGMIINDHFRKFVLYEDLHLSSLNAFPLFSSHAPLQHPRLHQRNNSSKILHGFGDWIAPRNVWHQMSDEELMWRASMVPVIAEYPFNRTPKVAFLFLTRGNLPLAPLWEMFFKGHQGFYSIYIHTGTDYTEETQKSSVFYNRKIPSKLVDWGRASMIDAERRLLANALLDFSNERFVLVSETCIPLFNFSTIYNYLLLSHTSFISIFDDPRPIGRGRYKKQMHPTITLSDWRKGSQWFEVNRQLALRIVSDRKFYPVFKKHCSPPCFMDEHYLATFVNKVCPNLASNRSVTWTDWSRGGSHPKMYKRNEVSVGLIHSIRNGSKKCSYNGGGNSICFLFARKFHHSSLQTLVRIARVLIPELGDPLSNFIPHE